MCQHLDLLHHQQLFLLSLPRRRHHRHHRLSLLQIRQQRRPVHPVLLRHPPRHRGRRQLHQVDPACFNVW